MVTSAMDGKGLLWIPRTAFSPRPTDGMPPGFRFSQLDLWLTSLADPRFGRFPSSCDVKD
jgi:hypothetical protein